MWGVGGSGPSLEARPAAALDGAGQLVLVAGEPGVGKSRLAEVIAERAAALGMLCGWGRAADDEGSPPYWPFRQLVRALRQTVTAAAELALVAPEIGVAPAAAERFALF